jgi:hypothetical protein
MATYRLGFYGFGDLTLRTAGGQTGTVLFPPRPTPGDLLVLAGAAPVLTPVQVETIGPRAVVAACSSFGTRGQGVDLDCRLTLRSDAAPAQALTFDRLRLDGTPVGLVGTAPLQPGMTYRVTDVTDLDTLAALRGHAGDELAAASAPEAVLCFTAGTLIDTPDGPRLIQALRPDDLVTTLGNGSQPLRWVGSRHVPVAEMLQMPELQPIEFAPGVIGNARALRVSPQHRILLNDWRAQVFFGEDEVLIPAKAMVNGGTIRQVLPAEGVTYIHLLFDRHEILVCEGALSESFHPGEAGLLALDAAQRRELELLFPALELTRRRAAFPILKLSEARTLRLPD